MGTKMSEYHVEILEGYKKVRKLCQVSRWGKLAVKTQ